VLAPVVAREDRVERAIGDVVPADNGLPFHSPIGMGLKRGALAIADAVNGVTPHDVHEQRAELAVRCGKWGRLRSLERFDETQRTAVYDVVDVLTPADPA